LDRPQPVAHCEKLWMWLLAKYEQVPRTTRVEDGHRAGCLAQPNNADQKATTVPAPTRTGTPMTEPSSAAIPMASIRQDRPGPIDREPSGLKSRENYEPTRVDAPDVNGDDRTFVIKPRRYVEVQLDGAGGPVRIELSVDQAITVGRALLDAAGKLDTPRSF
jgi:hypothetical protein